MAWGFIIATALSLISSKVEGDKNRKQQLELERRRRVAPPPMEREEAATVQLGAVDNELTPSRGGGAGAAQAGQRRVNQIGQLGGTNE